MATTQIQDPRAFLEHASDIASYFGFRPLKDINPESYKETAGKMPISFVNGALLCAQGSHGAPALAYWSSPLASPGISEAPSRESGEFSLQISGTTQSTAEIIIVKTLVSIVSEWGVPVSCVRVNAFGDRDSRERFARELGAYFRRRLSSAEEDKEFSRILEEPLSAYASSSPLIMELLREAPRPMHYLSEKSRMHFRELLDHLEQVGLPYELDDTLGGDEREPRILFRIVLQNAGTLVLAGSGGRYDDFIARLAGKRESAAVHGSIYFRKKGATPSAFKPCESAQPKIYFIQLGLHAKLKGLAVIDMLRHAHIPVAQSFDASRLSPQLEAAQAYGVSHLVIMGEREALDNTVILRAVDNSSQTVVPLQALPKYLRTWRV